MDLDGTPHKRKVNGYRLKRYLSRELPHNPKEEKKGASMQILSQTQASTLTKKEKRKNLGVGGKNNRWYINEPSP